MITAAIVVHFSLSSFRYKTPVTLPLGDGSGKIVGLKARVSYLTMILLYMYISYL